MNIMISINYGLDALISSVHGHKFKKPEERRDFMMRVVAYVDKTLSANNIRCDDVIIACEKFVATYGSDKLIISAIHDIDAVCSRYFDR